MVNPAARDEPASPIYGMPILDVDRAHTVMVIKAKPKSRFRGDPESALRGGQHADALRRWGEGRSRATRRLRRLSTSREKFGNVSRHDLGRCARVRYSPCCRLHGPRDGLVQQHAVRVDLSGMIHVLLLETRGLWRPGVPPGLAAAATRTGFIQVSPNRKAPKRTWSDAGYRTSTKGEHA